MHLSTRPRPGNFPQELPWKQSLLVSLIIHAAVLWFAMTWWQEKSQKVGLPPQVIEVEVVERVVSATVVLPVARPEQIVPAPTVRPSAPPVQPLPKVKVVTPPKRQAPTIRQSSAASQPELSQAMLTAETEKVDLLDESQGGQDTMTPEIMIEVSPEIIRDRTIDIRKAYTQQLKELIERQKQYPVLARKGRQQGRVVIEFSINTTGALDFVEVAQSSGHTLLDRAALKAVRAVDIFPEPPAALPKNSSFQIAISFKLE